MATAEYFKSFAAELAPALMEMYKEAMEEGIGILPPTLRQALISLVSKNVKDPVDCKNYCPISLMLLDAKIISKILANRLDRVITSIIHSDQVGFICGLSSSDNIRHFINIMWLEADVPHSSRFLLMLKGIWYGGMGIFTADLGGAWV